MTANIQKSDTKSTERKTFEWALNKRSAEIIEQTEEYANAYEGFIAAIKNVSDIPKNIGIGLDMPLIDKSPIEPTMLKDILNGRANIVAMFYFLKENSIKEFEAEGYKRSVDVDLANPYPP